MLVNKNLVLSALDCNAIFLTIGVKENKHKACAVWGDRSLGSLCHTTVRCHEQMSDICRRGKELANTAPRFMFGMIYISLQKRWEKIWSVDWRLLILHEVQIPQQKQEKKNHLYPW